MACRICVQFCVLTRPCLGVCAGLLFSFLQVLQDAEDAGVYLEAPVWNGLLMCAGGTAVHGGLTCSQLQLGAVIVRYLVIQLLPGLLHNAALHSGCCKDSSRAYFAAVLSLLVVIHHSGSSVPPVTDLWCCC